MKAMPKLEHGDQKYAAWIKIDDSLPWIELREVFRTKTEAHQSTKEKMNAVKIKVVRVP